MQLAPALLALLPIFVGSNETWVDAIHGDDLAGLGTEASPYRTITKAISSTTGGTTVHVAPGSYDGALGEVFPLALRDSMTLQGSGAHHTVISGAGDGTLVGLRKSTLVSDVTVTRGDVGIVSVGIFFDLGTMRYLRRVVVSDCDVGVFVEDKAHNDHGLALVNCAVLNNGTGIQGFSEDNDFQSITVRLNGTTVTRNDAGVVYSGFGERYLGIADSIVRGNGDDSLSSWLTSFPVTGSVLGDPAFVGIDGNVNVDPIFAEPKSTEYHLTTTSPAVDHPAPAGAWPPTAQWIAPIWNWETSFVDVADLDGDPRLAGTEFDPGADEVHVPSLVVRFKPQVGGDIELLVQADPGDFVVLFFGLAPLDPPLLGFIEVAPPWFQFALLGASPSGTATTSLSIPPDPVLVGADLYLQGVRPVGAWFDGTDGEWVRLLP